MNGARPLALVTGASSGIGFELARQLAERGFDPVVNQIGRRDEDDPARVARQGLDALFSGRDQLVAGSLRTKAQAHRTVAEPGSDDRDDTG